MRLILGRRIRWDLGRLDLFELDGLALTLNATASGAIAGDDSPVGAPVADANVDERAF